MEKNKKAKLILIVSISLFVGLGIVVSILDSQGVKWGKKKTIEEVVSGIELKSSLDSVGAGQMGFLFFEDMNINGEFDYEEKVVKNVAVGIRRPGETVAFITVPAEANGLVMVDNLPVGSYEVSYLNYELEQPYQAGDFLFKRYYQIVEEGKVRFSFLPSEWQRVDLTDSGFKLRVGIKEYQPESFLVIKNKEGVKFYDPIRARILGEGQIGIGFKLKLNKLYYFQDKKLIKFEIKTRLSEIIYDRFYGESLEDYWLSDDGSGLVYLDEEKQWQYDSEMLGCSGNLVTGDFERLVAMGDRYLADVYNSQVAVWTTSGAWLAICKGKEEMEFKQFNLSNLTSLQFLDQETWFYSDNSGSYFLNTSSSQMVKYTALGSSIRAIVSDDKKYIGSRVNESTVVVDYPAVKQSGVEKHYVLPYVGNLAFSRDEVLISQVKTCQEDGDCGEIIRISLKGNGVWEIKDRIELKDIQVEELLGEVY